MTLEPPSAPCLSGCPVQESEKEGAKKKTYLPAFRHQQEKGKEATLPACLSLALSLTLQQVTCRTHLAPSLFHLRRHQCFLPKQLITQPISNRLGR